MDYRKVDEVRRVLEVAAAGLAARARHRGRHCPRWTTPSSASRTSARDLEKSVLHRPRVPPRRRDPPPTTSCSWCCTTRSGEMLVEVRRRNLSSGRRRAPAGGQDAPPDPRRHRRPRPAGRAGGDARPPRPRPGDLDGRDRQALTAQPVASSCSSWVITSSSAACADCVLAMQRSSAARSSSGRSTRSAWPPSALPDAGVVAAQPVGGVALDGVRHPLAVAAHQPVVHDDRQDREAGADGGLEVHADHAEGGVAHDVDGRASPAARAWRPCARPRPVPSCVDLPQPR